MNYLSAEVLPWELGAWNRDRLDIHHNAISGWQGPGATESVQWGKQKVACQRTLICHEDLAHLASRYPGLLVFLLTEMLSWPSLTLILPVSLHPSVLLQLAQTLLEAAALAGSPSGSHLLHVLIVLRS